MTEHIIRMTETDDQTREHYGKTFRSELVYRTTAASSPTRINVWSNTGRPNPTDAEQSVLITPEAGVISAHGDGTGSKASGQVWAEQSAPIRTGDVLVLAFPNGTAQRVWVRMTNNGHGRAE